MKKILFAMATLAALASCQKADLTEQNSANTNGERVITAYFDNAGTKTTLDGVTPKWSENDKIMLLDETGKEEITLDGDAISADGKSVTITTTLEGTIYAVYPSNATSAEKVETANVPVTLSAENQDGTFASANICVAKENDGSLAFKNVTSVLHLTQTATTTKVNEIIITTPSASSAYIAGTGTVDMSATTPALTLNSGQSKKIKVKSASVKSDYYIAVAPTTLPEGTAFGFATGSQLGGTNLSEEKTIAANTIYHIGSMDLDAITPNTYHDYVEIGGLKWATMNVGAEKVANDLKYCAGDYYQWGYSDTNYNSIPWDSGISDNQLEITDWKSGKEDGFKWTTYTGFTASNEFTEWSPAPYDETTKNLLPAYDASTVNWKGSWHTPTSDDFQNLFNACIGDSGYDKATKPTGTPTKKGVYWCDNYDGVAGVLFYDGSGELFFPAAGGATAANNNEKKLVSLGLYATYWTSSRNSSSNYKANYRIFTSSTSALSQTGRYAGFTIRPVSD